MPFKNICEEDNDPDAPPAEAASAEPPLVELHCRICSIPKHLSNQNKDDYLNRWCCSGGIIQ